ncbi:MAG: sulfotransferase domain-containing protein, partial [Bacteroidota bacterium]
SDVFLVSYPRSGNTWCRVILAHLLYPDFTLQTLDGLHAYIPGIYRLIFPDRIYSQPRIIKTHQAFHQRLGKKDDQLYRKNIYIVRNVFDVAKSYYQYRRDRGQDHGLTYDDFAQRMAYGIYGPGTWQEHIKSWYGANQYFGKVLFVRYEDLMHDPIKEIARMAEFLGHPQKEEVYQRIANKSSIENMRLAQERGAIEGKTNFIRSTHVRSGELHLSAATRDLLYEHNAWALERFGYTKEDSFQD